MDGKYLNDPINEQLISQNKKSRLMFHPVELTHKNFKAKKQVMLGLKCYATLIYLVLTRFVDFYLNNIIDK